MVNLRVDRDQATALEKPMNCDRCTELVVEGLFGLVSGLKRIDGPDADRLLGVAIPRLLLAKVDDLASVPFFATPVGA